MKKVVIIDDDKELVNKLKNELEAEGFEVVGVAFNGEEGIAQIQSSNPDVVVTDIVMPRFDGFWLLEKIPRIHTFRIIVLSALSKDAFIGKAIELGADEYMIKPYVLSELVSKINDEFSNKLKSHNISQIVRTNKNYKVDERISNIFITVGIPAHIKGYQFLREAIKLTVDNPEIINSITKKLYPTIATKYVTSASKVERAIRHAIEVAWNRGRIENINSIFGIKVYTQSDRPTNGEFIALVADKILLEAM